MAPSFQFIVATLAFIGIASALSPPLCQSIAPPQETLVIQIANLTLSNTPFGIVYARNDIAFVGVGKRFYILKTSTFPLLQIALFPVRFGNTGFPTVQLPGNYA